MLAVITFCGAWLRISHLGNKSLWLDEGATVALARASWQHFAWVWWHGEANLQTIYFLLMRGWIHLGSSEPFLRLPSAIFGIVTIPALYSAARKFTGVWESLAAAALLAFSPSAVYYSQEARGYTLATLLVLASTYFFVRAVDGGRRRDWVLWTLCGMVAFYCHDFTALVLVAEVVSLLFKAPPVPWRKVILGGAIIFVAAVPGLTYVFRASPENLHFVWMPAPSLKESWHLAMFFGGSGLKVALSLVLWIAGLMAVIRARRNGAVDDYWRGMLLVMWAVVPAMLLALISLRQPMFLQRYVFFSLPAACMLAAIGAGMLSRWRLGFVLVLALCIADVPSVVKSYSHPREDWRGASRLVLSSASPGDAVAFFPFYTRVMLDYYASQTAGTPDVHVFAPAYYDGGEDVRNLLHALDENPRAFQHVWILMADHGAKLENFDYGAAAKAKLERIYGQPTVYRFADVDVLEYGK